MNTAKAFYMFNRERHNAIIELLHSFNSDFLKQTNCYFAGGTAIALALDEFRESVDIDFLCASADGYRLLRNAVSDNLAELLNKPVKYLRNVKTDQYKIFTILESNNIPVKLEIVREARIDITGQYDNKLQVPVLSKTDLFAQKLLANADRGLDKASMSRDIIDLAVMIDKWGQIPQLSWDKAVKAYGNQIPDYFAKSILFIHNEQYLKDCLNKMVMDNSWQDKIPKILLNSLNKLQNSGITFNNNLVLDELLEKASSQNITHNQERNNTFECYPSATETAQNSAKAYVMKLESKFIAFDSKDELYAYFNTLPDNPDPTKNPDFEKVINAYSHGSIVDYAEALGNYYGHKPEEIMDMSDLQELYLEH